MLLGSYVFDRKGGNIIQCQHVQLCAIRESSSIAYIG